MVAAMVAAVVVLAWCVLCFAGEVAEARTVETEWERRQREPLSPRSRSLQKSLWRDPLAWRLVGAWMLMFAVPAAGFFTFARLLLDFERSLVVGWFGGAAAWSVLRVILAELRAANTLRAELATELRARVRLEP
jgi:hypothetical protein